MASAGTQQHFDVVLEINSCVITLLHVLNDYTIQGFAVLSANLKKAFLDSSDYCAAVPAMATGKIKRTTTPLLAALSRPNRLSIDP